NEVMLSPLIRWPNSLCHYRASVHLLQLLDEKIANNSALAADLEAIARAFFKSWFVDFDPVKAKMEGRLPVGMDADTAALFPDELIESELGLIPCGWEAATLANHAALNPESWSARNHPETVQYADLAGTDRGQIVETKTFVWEDAPSRARRVLRLGDTIIGTVRPGNRAYSFVGVDGLTGSTGFAVLRPNNSSQRSLVYLAATSDDAINRLVNLADGAAYPAVRPDVVAATPIVTPPDAVIEEFAKITQPLLDWVVAAHAENTELAQLRDILLPRLISGKLRLPGVFNDTEPTLSEEHTNV
ncbi:MAG: restriction endonuclease subunit S, partial [Spongiibacter sp.]